MKESPLEQKGRLVPVWSKKGSAPEAVKQTGYKNLWVTTAVCPETREAEGRMSEKMNTVEMNEFLEQLSERVGEKRHVVLVWDRAGYHVSHDLQVPPNVSVVWMPPYQPATHLDCGIRRGQSGAFHHRCVGSARAP